MTRKLHGPSPERTKTDKSLEVERTNTDDAIRGDRKSAERVAEKVIDKARAVADAIVTAERKKTDESKHPARRVTRQRLSGQRAAADSATRGERKTADTALRSDLKERANALEALLVHERAATDAYLLTERVRSDDDVAHRDDFLGMVAHDVRNLLNGVMLNLELLAPVTGMKAANPQVAAATGRIRRDVGRMNRLIGDLVDVTSIDAGKLAMIPVDGDAGALVREAADTFQVAAAAKGVVLSAEVPTTPLPASFDPDRLLQVFANLLSNAIKFTPPAGRIELSVEKVRGALQFCVRDTGVGVAAPMLKAIFERFWQVGKNDHRGLGLGLYISKCIVEAHRGRIWAKSKPGKGSEFYFTLPMRAGRARGVRRSSTK
jgi:signal transduction histidine kinase